MDPVQDADWISNFVETWPQLAWLIPIAFVLFYAVKFLSLVSEPVNRLLGPIGRHWKETAERKRPARQEEVDDLRSEVTALSKRLDIFRIRDQIYWEYVIYDEGWHRAERLRLTRDGLPIHPHKSFPDYQVEWLTARKMDLKDFVF